MTNHPPWFDPGTRAGLERGRRVRERPTRTWRLRTLKGSRLYSRTSRAGGATRVDSGGRFGVSAHAGDRRTWRRVVLLSVPYCIRSNGQPPSLATRRSEDRSAENCPCGSAGFFGLRVRCCAQCWRPSDSRTWCVRGPAGAWRTPCTQGVPLDSAGVPAWGHGLAHGRARGSAGGVAAGDDVSSWWRAGRCAGAG